MANNKSGYRSVTDADNKYIGFESPRDAEQALKEMHSMIAFLTGNDLQEIYDVWVEGYAIQASKLRSNVNAVEFWK